MSAALDLSPAEITTLAAPRGALPVEHDRQVVQTPMALLTHAVQNGASIDTMEKLMALHERYEAAQARKAFDEAVSLAKAAIGPVSRNKEGHNKKRYADFAAIAATVDPVISKYGLSYRFRTKQDSAISVTCILSHRDGHSEENTLTGPADASGSKNAIQAIGSTLTYLQRYSLVQALGLAAADDDDGQSAGKTEPERPYISEDQETALRDLIEAAGTTPEAFCGRIKVPALGNIYADKYDAACAVLKKLMMAER
jgi:hypothetical protein